jgi:hypothetical protein
MLILASRKTSANCGYYYYYYYYAKDIASR